MRPLAFLHLAGNLALVCLKFNKNNVESSAHPHERAPGKVAKPRLWSVAVNELRPRAGCLNRLSVTGAVR